MTETRPEAIARTQALARVIGPFVAIVTTIIAIRVADAGAIVDELFSSQLLIWLFGALLVFGGVLIISLHSFWRNAPAVVISLFGWFLLLRGVGLLVAPAAFQAGADLAIDDPVLLVVARVFFGLLAAIGLWLVYVGWIAPRRTRA